ncbi:RNA-directed DNA polymerase-like protein [Gossypium australe]|uniref:RNA-directed DNA polymerase-like protein n=1 Tax=Gossypium australe TaxID=47621 RepID=A0A5B6WFS5_9ROSI|nr:RNA-directed DNA polymerase-like protein [Gossypium australe]
MTSRSCYRHYKFLVMLFGLTNVPVVFMDLMNKAVNEILVYSKSMADHEQHLEIVLRTLQENKLYVKFSKCKFLLKEVCFLGHIIYAKGIKLDPIKIKVALYWIPPRNVIEFEWVEACQRRFDKIKAVLTEAPILAQPESGVEYTMFTKAFLKWIGKCPHSKRECCCVCNSPAQTT